MFIGRALVLFAALFIGLNPANADNDKFKYLLQCGNAKSVPPDSDPDPIVWTRIAATPCQPPPCPRPPGADQAALATHGRDVLQR
jgi:hypothetical protein